MPAVMRYAKTPKGQEEISARRSNLRGKLRTMLILTDASKSAEELRAQGELIGVAPDFLDTLAAEGYIAAVANDPVNAAPDEAYAAATPVTLDELARFRQTKAFMNETAVSFLGLRAFLFTLKLERCSTRADLALLAPDYERALRKTVAEAEVRLMAERLREMLA